MVNIFVANSYWLTSYRRTYALTFAKNALHHLDVVGGLYEIECDLQDQDDSIVNADISDLPEEEEVLFDADPLFRIEVIANEIEDDMNPYTIRICPTKEGREIVSQYIKYKHISMELKSPGVTLGSTLLGMGKV